MFRKKKLSNYELKRQVRIRKMRVALYDLLWKEIHKDDKRPMSRPDTTGTSKGAGRGIGDTILEELREIVNG